MLSALSIRDVVLIETLDIGFMPGLGVLTGETGAGKSILLDALGLALGARADNGLLRTGADRAQVVATFDFPVLPDAIAALLTSGDIAVEPGEALILRRSLRADGGSRAFINDQPVSAGMLRDLGALLVEVHGQHDDRGLLDSRGHRALLDAFSGADRTPVAAAFAQWQAASAELAEVQAAAETAARDSAWLAHALEEIRTMAPQPGEESVLAEARAAMQRGERLADDLAALNALFTSSDGAVAQLRSAARRLDRIAAEHPLLAEALAALDRAVIEAGEAEALIERAAEALTFDAERLDRLETRLFDLRGLARKHGVSPDALAALGDELAARFQAIALDAERMTGLETQVSVARDAYRTAAAQLTEARIRAARRLDTAVADELAPLKLDAARFRTAIEPLPEERWGPAGADRVEFLIATNPGAPFGALARIASGGELSRFILALKVALAEEGAIRTILFDEIDRGVGGAVASAIGERLARLAAGGRQILVVTHSPQVAAKGTTHYFIAKSSVANGARTNVMTLDADARRLEIARMLSGAEVTAEACAQAERLLEGA